MSKKKKIMMVDDVLLNHATARDVLEDTYDLYEAHSGTEAFEMLKDVEPDLILLDLMMPGIDGFEVIRRLRADPATADIQIVILSALNSQEDVVKGFNVGANDFIMKPIIMEKLLSCVITQMQLVEVKAKNNK